jgi:hypothetical protein
MTIRFKYFCLLILFLASCRDGEICKASFELAENDFEDNPIWENYITIKSYQESGTTDTFTPHLDNAAINPDKGYFLVAANFELADKSKYKGYVSPETGRFDSTKIVSLNPTMFVNNKHITFWRAANEVDSLFLFEFYQTIDKKKEDVFPITFYVDAKLQTGMRTGTINGIGYCTDHKCDSIRFIR